MSKKTKKSRVGVCKLTGNTGQFVDSHLLPKALTKADGLAPGLIQLGNGQKQKRSSSWYDQHLVTSEGEKILAEYDDWAIRILRKHSMVWSGWVLSDIKLFQFNGSSMSELSGTAVQIEKSLQNIFEANLEALLGIRFLASEHSTGAVHGKRII